MFKLVKCPFDAKSIKIDNVYETESGLCASCELDLMFHLETLDATLGALPDYRAAVEAILEQSEEWSEKDGIGLDLKLSSVTLAWTIKVQGDGDPLEITFNGAIKGAPKLTIAPQKETTLKAKIVTYLAGEDFGRALMILGPGVKIAWCEEIQRDLFASAEKVIFDESRALGVELPRLTHEVIESEEL